MDHSLPQRQPVDRPSRAHGLVGGAAPQFLAIDASRALVDLGLLSKPQTSNCRPATGETIGKAKACRAGGTVQVYLNLAGRDPAGGGFTQVADAMRLKYAGVDAAYTNSGGLRADLNCAPPSAGEAACEITWGEMFSVLPFGNRTVIETLTGAQLELAFLNGFSPKCNPAIATGRFPQISGLKAQYHCNGLLPVVDGIWKAPNGVTGALTLVGPTDTVRFVTNDFMYTGGDGYTVFSQGTNVLQPGDDLLQVSIDYVTANSPVGPVVDGRISGP